MGQFASYGHALLSVAVFILLVQVLNPLSAITKEKAGLTAGQTPKPDYGDRTYRMHRAYQNAVETLAVFVAAVAVAILAGASPFWVNLLASLGVLSRLATTFVHVQGIGKPHRGPRTFIFVFGWAINIALALMAIFAVFG